MKFINRKKYIADTGITPDVFDHWRKKHWEAGVHYTIIGHQTMLDLEEVEKWVESKFTENSQPESIKSVMQSSSNLGNRKSI